MEPIHRCKGKDVESKAPVPSRFRDFDNLDAPVSLFATWSICVRVDVKFPTTSYGQKLRFILMDKSGTKIEAFVTGSDLVEKFNRKLHMGCKYIIHGVIIQPNMEDLEFRNIEHTHECVFNEKTYVDDSCPSLDFPLLPKHLTPFWDIIHRPNRTFVDVVGIVVHCGELEHLGRYRDGVPYREVTFMDSLNNLIAVGLYGGRLIERSYLWSEGNKPIVIATMLKQDEKYGCFNATEYTTLASNPDHPAARELQDIRQKIISGAMNVQFVKQYIKIRLAFLASVLAKEAPRYRKR